MKETGLLENLLQLFVSDPSDEIYLFEYDDSYLVGRSCFQLSTIRIKNARTHARIFRHDIFRPICVLLSSVLKLMPLGITRSPFALIKVFGLPSVRDSHSVVHEEINEGLRHSALI